MEMLDNKSNPIEEVCIESEEEEKMREVENISEGSDDDLYTRSQMEDFYQYKKCKEWTYNQVDWTKFLTAEAKELNMTKTKLEDQLLQISSLYAMTNPLLWFQNNSTDEKYCFKTIIIPVQFDLPKNDSTAYQESTFSVDANNMSSFQKKIEYNILEGRTLMHQNSEFMQKHVFNN